MIHMKLFLKSPPITQRNGVLIAAPPLAEWLCVCCAQGWNHWPAHVSASLSTRGVLGPTIKPRGSGCRLPAIRGLSKALRGNYPSTVMTPIGTCHLHYKGKIVVGEIL